MAESLIKVHEPMTYFKGERIDSVGKENMLYCVLNGSLKLSRSKKIKYSGDIVEFSSKDSEDLLILEESTLIEIEGKNIENMIDKMLPKKIIESTTHYISEMRDYLYKK